MSTPPEIPRNVGSRLSCAAPAFGGALLILALMMISGTLVDQISRFPTNLKSALISASYLVLPVSFSLIALVLIFRCKDEKAITRIALAVVAVSMLSRLAWISVYDSYQVNDFGYYLQCGSDVVRTGTPEGSRFCEGAYWKRTAFYTLPLVRYFGPSLLAIKLFNVLLATLSAWIFFQGCGIFFSPRTAAIALLFFVWNPDIWYSITLASHDVPGLFWLALFYYLCGLMHRHLMVPSSEWRPLAAISLGMGVSLFFLDFSRSYQYGAILALALYAAVHAGLVICAGTSGWADVAGFGVSLFPQGATGRDRIKTALVHTAFLLLLPLAVYRIATTGFWLASPVKPGQGETGLTCYLSVMDVLGTSDYEEINNWYDRQCPLIKGREKTIFAIRKVLHDVTNDRFEFLRHLERKNRVLGRSDDYIEWSTYKEPDPWDTSRGQVRRLNRDHLDEQYQAVSMAQTIVLALVLWRLLLYPRLPFRLLELIPISFSAVYFLMFLLLVESQPRYDIFLVFPFSWMAAAAVEDLRRRAAGEPVPVADFIPMPRARIYIGGMLVLALLVGAYWGAAVLIADSSLTLRDQLGFAQVPSDQVATQARRYHQAPPAFIRNNHKQVMLAYPPGITLPADSIVAVQRTFTIKSRPQHHLRFFISNYSVRAEPFDKKITWEDTDMEYLIAINGKILDSGGVNAIRDNKYFSFSENDGVIFAPTMTLQLIIRNLQKIDAVEPFRGPIISLEYIDLQ